MDDADLIHRYFAAMRRGAEAEEEMMGLFADNATYVEPFTSAEPAVGIEQIRNRLRAGWATPLPDLELDVLSLEVDGSTGRATWECRSPALPSPVRGEDLYEIHDGKIVRLEVRLTS
jgi:hypothetical protein